MHRIQSCTALVAACNRTPDPELGGILDGYVAALEEFGDEFQAEIIILERGDALAAAEHALARRLVAEGRFTFPVEVITRGEAWLSIVWVYSDDGAGIVLLIDIAGCTDARLIAACDVALTEATG
ncbi:MAG: hypothetical protein EOO82_00575 [Oxalobacteraceae bacterium]|nr:MAG: hypothetical protein EOO82_00575 [Oxalobacteraceae bacterium]